MRSSYKDYLNKKRVDWVIDNKSAQITLLISLLYWCSNVEEAFKELSSKKNAMTIKADLFQKQLEDLIRMVQGKLEKPTRTKIMCMITLDTHGRDIAIKLDQEKVMTAEGFQWQAQIKA